jgi:hypothetical protein
MRRTLVVLSAVGALAAAPLVLAPADAVVRADQDFSGFTTQATATPLKIEVYEPSIPIPSDPQVEMDFSYTRVDGQSGPSGSARASAMWPGDSVGEGFRTFGEQLGLPKQLWENGYPTQVNAQSDGDVTQAAQEPLPGMVSRVNATDHKATAKVGYGAGGDVAEGDSGDDPAEDPGGDSGGTAPAPANPLAALANGDLSALGNVLTGSTTGSADDPVPSSPLGALSALVDPSGMESISTTDYSGDSVIAKATSRLGQLSLLGGLVKMTGVEVVAKTTSNIADGAKTSTKITYGGMTIAGVPYGLTADGIEGGGNPTPIPGLPSDATDALKALGISIDMPKPDVTTDGPTGQIAARGITITIDTQPLRSKLPSLPLDALTSQMPDSAAQLKSLLLALNEAHPKFVISLGAVTSQATTVAGFGSDGGSSSTGDTGSTTAAGPGSTGATASGASAGAAPPAVATPEVSAPAEVTTPIKEVAAVPGLPPLGSVPGMLALLGVLLAGGAGWYLRRAGGLLFGVGSTCTHGLNAGVPDLRKA